MQTINVALVDPGDGRALRWGRPCARAAPICWSRPIPAATNAFDAPGDKVILRSDVPNGVHPGEGVHVGANPPARAAANEQVRAFLRERLRQPDQHSYWSP